MGVQINGDTGNISATKADYSGNVTIGGTLTYEDVTNVDSIGIVTARNGIEVGARPGVAASVSVDGNAIFSGIVTATEFKGDGSGLTGVANTNVIFTDKLQVGDSPELISVGVGSDLQISHLSDSSYIKHVPTSTLFVQSGSNIVLENTDGTNYVRAVSGGAAELYHNGSKKLETASGGVTVTGTVGATAVTGDGSALTGITTGPYGNYQFSSWYLNSDFQNQDATRDTIENWSESNAPNYERLGTAPSYSSGIWTFPSTGYWRIQASMIYYLSSQDGDSFALALDSSTDSGSSFDQFATTGGRFDGNQPANVKLCWVMQGTVKVANVSTFRMRVSAVGTKASTGHFMGASQASGQLGHTSTLLIEKMSNL